MASRRSWVRIPSAPPLLFFPCTVFRIVALRAVTEGFKPPNQTHRFSGYHNAVGVNRKTPAGSCVSPSGVKFYKALIIDSLRETGMVLRVVS